MRRSNLELLNQMCRERHNGIMPPKAERAKTKTKKLIIMKAETKKMNKIDFKRIAFWAKQPVFTREITVYKDKDGNEETFYGDLCDVYARAARLKRMHEEFGTLPEDILNSDMFQSEPRRILKEIYQAN